MNKLISGIILTGVAFAGCVALAAPFPVEMIMGNGNVWKGALVSRDGDWVVFSKDGSPQPIRLGASTIKELKFEVELDAEKVNDLLDARQYDTIIEAIKGAMKPFAEYRDIPSNLTPYDYLLMQMYYLTRQYDASLAISTKITEENGDPAIKEKSRGYRILSLIESGRTADADALLVEYGWDKAATAETPPAELYIRAKLLSGKQQYADAMEFVAKVIAFNSQDQEWMQPAEMLCAEIYLEMKLYDSADEVCREIILLYKDTLEFDKAQQLKIRIEKLRAEEKLESSLESE